jgi:hypothetical protein
MASVLCFGQDGAWPERLLAAAADVIARVPFYNLHFRRDPSFWACLDALEKES